MNEKYSFNENLGYLLNRCAAGIAARFQKELAPYDITLAQWGALLAIHEEGTAAPSKIAARVGIDRGATSRLVARMEAKGMIERVQHTEDGRSVLLSLTLELKNKMPKLIRLSRQVNADTLATVPEAQRETLLRALSQLNETLNVP